MQWVSGRTRSLQHTILASPFPGFRRPAYDLSSIESVWFLRKEYRTRWKWQGWKDGFREATNSWAKNTSASEYAEMAVEGMIIAKEKWKSIKGARPQQVMTAKDAAGSGCKRGYDQAFTDTIDQ